MNRHESTGSEEAVVGLKFLYRKGRDSTSPLVVLVHGRAGNRSVMWTFERSIPSEAHVVAFEAFIPDSIGGWSWWNMDGSQHVGDEEIDCAASRLTSAYNAFISHYGLTPSKVVGMGFSQGSILLSYVGLRSDVSFDGIAILAGQVPGIAVSQGGNVRTEFLVSHGTQDEILSVEKAREGVVALKNLGLHVEYIEEDVGHKVGIQGTRALKTWLLRVLGNGN